MSVHTERAFEIPASISVSLRWQNDANATDANDASFSNCNLTTGEIGQQTYLAATGRGQRVFIGIELDWEITASNFRVRWYNQEGGGNELFASIEFASRSRRVEQFFFGPSKRGPLGQVALEVLRILGSSNSGVHIHEFRFITAQGETAPVEGGA